MKKTRKIGKYTIVFIVPIICMVVHMVLKSCYPFGDNTILVGDANEQYWLFAERLLDKIKNGNSILFSWNGGLGYEFFSNFWYYLGSPFNIIALAIGVVDIELGLVIAMLIQVGLCGVTMLYYLCHTARNHSEWTGAKLLFCVMLSLAYAMCDYMLAYQYQYIWLIGLVMAPLVMLGVEYLVWKSDSRLYIVALIVAFVTNFYFSWFICILSFVWYVDCCRGSVRRIISDGVSYLKCSIIAAMVACFVFVPCFFSILGRENLMFDEDSYGIWTFGGVSDFLQGFLWGSAIDIRGMVLFTNNNYVGIVVIFLFIIYLTNKGILLKSRIKRLVEVLTMSLGANWVVGTYIFHGFAYPNALCNRQAFILSILLIVSAYEAVINENKIKLKDCVLAGVTGFAVIVISLFGNTDVESVTCYLGSIMIGSYVVICMILYFRGSIGRKSFLVNLAILGMLELFSNHYLVNSDSFDSALEVKAMAEQWEGEYKALETEIGERKTSWMLAQNDTAHSDTNIFSSILNRNIWSMYDALGLTYQSNGGSYAYKGSTPVTAALFNVRYVLSDTAAYFGGYTKTDVFDIYDSSSSSHIECGLYDTEYTCGLGYMIDDAILKWSMDEENPFEVQNVFTRDAVGVGEVFESVDTDDVEVALQGAEMLRQEGMNISYMNILDSDDYFSIVAYRYTVSEDMHLYVYAEDNSQATCSLSVDGTNVVDINSYLCKGFMLDAGEVKKGQKVTLMIYNNTSPGDVSASNAYFYKYDDDVMQQVVSNLRDEQYAVSDMGDTYVTGTVSTKSGGLLYTSIPYYRGFKAYVDGEQVDIVQIADALCGVELSPGEHTVEFKYFPYGLKLGILISLFGVAAFVITVCRNRSNRVK